jgi:hypothetical protein
MNDIDLRAALQALEQEPPADLLAQLRAQVPPPALPTRELWAWAAAPLVGGLLLGAWALLGWHVQPELPALALPVLAAAALHGLTRPRIPR